MPPRDPEIARRDESLRISWLVLQKFRALIGRLEGPPIEQTARKNLAVEGELLLKALGRRLQEQSDYIERLRKDYRELWNRRMGTTEWAIKEPLDDEPPPAFAALALDLAREIREADLLRRKTPESGG